MSKPSIVELKLKDIRDEIIDEPDWPTQESETFLNTFGQRAFRFRLEAEKADPREFALDYIRVAIQYLESQSWENRLAATVAMPAVVDCCHGVIDLQQATYMFRWIQPLFSDPHPRVRYFACETLNHLTQLYPKFLVKNDAEVFRLLFPVLKRETVVRCQAKFMETISITIHECDPKTFQKEYLDKCMTILEDMLQKSSANMREGENPILRCTILAIGSVADTAQDFSCYYQSTMKQLFNTWGVCLKYKVESMKKLRNTIVNAVTIVAKSAKIGEMFPDKPRIIEMLTKHLTDYGYKADGRPMKCLVLGWCRMCRKLNDRLRDEKRENRQVSMLDYQGYSITILQIFICAIKHCTKAETIGAACSGLPYLLKTTGRFSVELKWKLWGRVCPVLCQALNEPERHLTEASHLIWATSQILKVLERNALSEEHIDQLATAISRYVQSKQLFCEVRQTLAQLFKHERGKDAALKQIPAINGLIDSSDANEQAWGLCFTNDMLESWPEFMPKFKDLLKRMIEAVRSTNDGLRKEALFFFGMMALAKQPCSKEVCERTLPVVAEMLKDDGLSNFMKDAVVKVTGIILKTRPNLLSNELAFNFVHNLKHYAYWNDNNGGAATVLANLIQIKHPAVRHGKLPVFVALAEYDPKEQREERKKAAQRVVHLIKAENAAKNVINCLETPQERSHSLDKSTPSDRSNTKSKSDTIDIMADVAERSEASEGQPVVSVAE